MVRQKSGQIDTGEKENMRVWIAVLIVCVIIGNRLAMGKSVRKAEKEKSKLHEYVITLKGGYRLVGTSEDIIFFENGFDMNLSENCKLHIYPQIIRQVMEKK